MTQRALCVDILQQPSQCVSQDKVVRLGYRVIEKQNNTTLQYGNDLVYIHGGYGGVFPKVESSLSEKRLGDRIELDLLPEEGYGFYDSSLTLRIPLEGFGGAIPEIGEPVEGELPDGSSKLYYVTGVCNNDVLLDGNHPFAGKTLVFHFEILEIRDASSAERAVGYA